MKQARDWFQFKHGQPMSKEDLSALFADMDYNQARWDRRKAEIEAEEAAKKAATK